MFSTFTMIPDLFLWVLEVDVSCFIKKWGTSIKSFSMIKPFGIYKHRSIRCHVFFDLAKSLGVRQTGTTCWDTPSDPWLFLQALKKSESYFLTDYSFWFHPPQTRGAVASRTNGIIAIFFLNCRASQCSLLVAVFCVIFLGLYIFLVVIVGFRCCASSISFRVKWSYVKLETRKILC